MGRLRGVEVDDEGCDNDDLVFCGAVRVSVPTDQPWDDLVALAVTSDWVGLEALSGLSGSIAEAVTGNYAAHGQQVAETIWSVRTWDHRTDRQRTFAQLDCEFGSGSSVFGDDRFELLEVSFLFRQGNLTFPIHDAELCERLGLRPGARTELAQVRSLLTTAR